MSLSPEASSSSPYYIYFVGFWFVVMLSLIVITLGFFFKANWARLILLWLFYAGLLVLTGITIFNFYEVGFRDQYFSYTYSAITFGYCVLIAGGALLDSKALKEEFGAMD